MTLEESQQKAIETQGVEAGKFDRHMRRARQNDIESRKKVFIHQSEQTVFRNEQFSSIKPSVY